MVTGTGRGIAGETSQHATDIFKRKRNDSESGTIVRNDENNMFFVAVDDCIIIKPLQIFGGEEGKELKK